MWYVSIKYIIEKWTLFELEFFVYLFASGYDDWRLTLGWMNDMWYHAQDYHNNVHSPIFLDAG